MSKLKIIKDTLILFSQWIYLEISYLMTRKSYHNQNKYHLALFAWALPPNSNAGVYRPLSFIRYGSELGWRTSAFQGSIPDNQSEHGDELMLQIPKTAKLSVVPSPSLTPSYKLSPQIDGGFKNALAYANYAIKYFATEPPNIVFASGPPFHVFVAAFFVARWFKVPLVLDYRDEWTECPFDFVSVGKQDLFWEKRCLAAADAVLFTTHSHLRHQLQKFSELSDKKVHLIPNGWEPNDFFCHQIQSRSPHDSGDRIFNLAHIGSLAGHNPPHDFLKALAELLTEIPSWRKRIKVSFIGRRSSAANTAIHDFPYQDNIEIIDHVGKKEANLKMLNADALLLLSSPDLERYLPGKLFDYIAAGRPILAFGSSGEASTILETLGVGVFCPPCSLALLDERLNYILNASNTGNDVSVQAWLDLHRRDKLAKQFFTLIGSIID